MQPPNEVLAYQEASLTIGADPVAVYALVSDITRMGEWSPENVGGEWLDGGAGQVGDRFEGRTRTPEREWSRGCEVACAQPGRDFTFVVGGVQANCTWWSYEMTPAGIGTRLTERWWIVNKTPALAAASPEQFDARVDATEAMLTATLAALKVTAEREALHRGVVGKGA